MPSRLVISRFENGIAVLTLDLERELQQLLFQGDDAREGLGAHLAKREPQFTGR